MTTALIIIAWIVTGVLLWAAIGSYKRTHDVPFTDPTHVTDAEEDARRQAGV